MLFRSAAAPATREIEVLIEETDTPVTVDTGTLTTSSDLIQAYEDLGLINGRLEWFAPAGQPVSIRLWFPIPGTSEEPETPAAPTAPSPVPPEPPAPAIITPQPAPPSAHHRDERFPDRRMAPRSAVHLPARVTVGPSTREGTVLTLSETGASVVLTGPLPHLSEQPAYLVLKTVVGILELQATVHERGMQAGPTGGEQERPVLAFEFSPPGETERKVLV